MLFKKLHCWYAVENPWYVCVRGCSLASMWFNYKDERRLALSMYIVCCSGESVSMLLRCESLCIQGRPPLRLQKVCRFQVPKMNPLNIARCCSESNRQISKCGNTSLYIAKFWSVQTCNFFSVGSRTYRISYSHFKSCTVALWFFSIYFLVAKTEKLTSLLATLSATISQIWARSPAPPAHNDSAK